MKATCVGAFVQLILALALAHALPVVAAPAWRQDPACQLSDNSWLVPFTGFRVQRQLTFGWPLKYHTALTKCTNGRVDFELFVPTPRTTDIEWATTMCPDTDSATPSSPTQCYRFVRRKKYAQRPVSFYVPDSFVGGLFECPIDEPCTNANAKPLLPLLADRTYNSWTRWTGPGPPPASFIRRVPYLYTPQAYDLRRLDPAYMTLSDVFTGNIDWSRLSGVALDFATRTGRSAPAWASALDIDEEYNYTDADAKTVSWAVTHIITIVDNFGRNLTIGL